MAGTGDSGGCEDFKNEIRAVQKSYSNKRSGLSVDYRNSGPQHNK